MIGALLFESFSELFLWNILNDTVAAEVMFGYKLPYFFRGGGGSMMSFLIIIQHL